jgi:ketosteroid isomerase-like protein
VRTNFEAWNAGDMDTWRDLLDPDVIMRNPEGWPEPGPQVGREAVVRFTEQLRDTWHADSLEVVSDYAASADRVAVRFVWHGVGEGPDPNLELTGVYTVRDGTIFGMEFFWDHAAALEVVGMSE